jgi:spermidine/putrescine transport system substrate-binding protein
VTDRQDRLSIDRHSFNKEETMKKLTDQKRYERLLSAFEHGDIDRRTLFRIIGATAATVGVVGGPLGLFAKQAFAAGVDSIRFDGWGGIVSEAFHNAFPDFTKQTGIEVVEGEFGDTDEFLASVKAAQPGDYAVFLVSGVYDYYRFFKQGHARFINEANIPNLANLLPATLEAFRNESEGKLCAVPFDYGTTGIAYNRKFVSDEEAKSGLYDGFQTRAWMACLKLGQDPQGATDPAAMWEAVRQQRELVLKYWGSGQEFIDLMSKEEIVLSDGWSGRAAYLKQNGVDLGWIDTANAGFAWLEGLMALKDSPEEATELLLNFCSEPKISIAIAEGQNYPPALDPNKVELTDKVKALPGFDPTGKFENYVWEKAKYWYDNQDAYKKEWDRISKGA